MENLITTITSSFWFETIIKLTLGFLLAGIIGFERSSWNKPAGFRTYSIVGISAVLLVLCGEYISESGGADVSRLPAQMLSGVGFIGAGTILRDGFNVKGLTTAAGLLAVTCIGLSIGMGFYFGGILTTIVVYFVLSASHVVTDKLEHFQELDFKITISQNPKETIKYIEKILTEYDVEIEKIERVSYNDSLDEDKDSKNSLIRIISYYNKRNINKNKLISSISALKSVVEVSTASDKNDD